MHSIRLMVLLVLPRMLRPITTITQHQDDVLYCSHWLSDGSNIHDLSYSGSFDGTSMKKYLVEVITQHRVRYVVEARNEDDAEDEITLNIDDLIELSQLYLGTVIVSSREVTEDKVINIFDKDNPNLKDISHEQKLTFINTIEYEDKEAFPEEREWAYDGLGNKIYKGTMKLYDK